MIISGRSVHRNHLATRRLLRHPQTFRELAREQDLKNYDAVEFTSNDENV